jgi:hypothetical protein
MGITYVTPTAKAKLERAPDYILFIIRGSIVKAAA